MNTKKFLCKYFGETKQADKETGEILPLDESWDRRLNDKHNTMVDVKVVSIWSFISRGAAHTIKGLLHVGVLGIIIYLMTSALTGAQTLQAGGELVGLNELLAVIGLFVWITVILVVGTIILYYVYKYLDKKEICRCIDKE